MKKLMIMMAAALLSFAATAQEKSGLNFLESKTVAEAMTKAKESGKILMVDVYAVWCGPCKKLSADVFPSKEVESLNSQIVGFKLNAEEGEGPQYAKDWKVRAYPTLIFFKDGKELTRMVGAPLVPTEFVKTVNEKIAEATK